MTRVRIPLAVLLLGAAALVPLITIALGAQQTDRARLLGTKIKCMCGGCNDAAGKCYHIGGAFSGPCDTAKTMLKELDQRAARGEADDLVLQSFVQEYGPTVYV